MFLDTALARRIEAGEALNAAQCGEALPVAGGYAAFAGVGSALTHAIGLGMNGPVTAAEFNEMEEFYRSRGAWVNLDFCPYADPSLMDLLGKRGYRVVECSNVLAGPVAGSPDARVRPAQPEEADLWCRIMLEGFFLRKDLTIDEMEMAHRLFRQDGGAGWFGTAGGLRAPRLWDAISPPRPPFPEASRRETTNARAFASSTLSSTCSGTGHDRAGRH